MNVRPAPAATTEAAPSRQRSLDPSKDTSSPGRQAGSTVLLHRGAAPGDTLLAATVVGLSAFGVVMVYSASAFEATVRVGDAQHYVRRQALYAGAALVTMWLVSRFDYQRLRSLTYPLLLAVVAALVATVFGLGHRAGNAYRWLPSSWQWSKGG